MQIIPQTSFGSRMGQVLGQGLENIGVGFGHGLSKGFDALAKLKLMDMLYKRDFDRFKDLLDNQNAAPNDNLASSLLTGFGSQGYIDPYNNMLSSILQGKSYNPYNDITKTFQPEQITNIMNSIKPRVNAIMPDKLRTFADKLELIDPHRFASRISDLRKRARAMESEERQIRGEKRRAVAKGGRKLTESKRLEFLTQADGDIAKAKQLAMQAGYSDE